MLLILHEVPVFADKFLTERHKKTGNFLLPVFIKERIQLKNIPQTKLHLPARRKVGTCNKSFF
jgi:hypothetical protein